MVDLCSILCLNRIVILHESEEGEAAVLALFDEPDFETPDYQGVLGLKWTYTSSVVINLTTIEACVREVVEEADREGDFLDYEIELKYGFAGTLLQTIFLTLTDGVSPDSHAMPSRYLKKSSRICEKF